MRNAAIALGNSKNSSAIAPLMHALKTNRYPLVRAHIAWALAELQATEAVGVLKDVLEHEEDETVIAEIKDALMLLEQDHHD